MIYDVLLKAHSGLRWIVLVLLIAAIAKSIGALSSKRGFTDGDKKIALFALIVTHLQLVIGLVLYFISPLIKGAMYDMGAAMKSNVLRFWAVEHLSLMILAIILITIGYSSSKRAKTDLKKFKRLAVFYTIGLVLILVSIPWPFREEIGAGREWF